MEENIGITYLLHSIGRSDLDLNPETVEHESKRINDLIAANTDNDVTRIRNILRPAEPKNGKNTPLASACSVLTNIVNRLHLVLLTTNKTVAIGKAIKQALDRVPNLYDVTFADVTIVCGRSLVESDVVTAIRRTLGDLIRRPVIDRAMVVLGSGATQLAFSVTEAVMDLGLPWSFVLIHLKKDAQPVIYDPARDLPVDPIVPLLRRWRHHDLLKKLVEHGWLAVEKPQRVVIEREAEEWGNAYISPTPASVPVLMAAAVMRQDGSSGFVANPYIFQRYAGLHEQEPEATDLIAWAERDEPRSTLGTILKKIRKSTCTNVQQSRDETKSGQWLMRIDRLNEMGRDSRHEFLPPTPEVLDFLETELAELDKSAGTVQEPHLFNANLDTLRLAPARTVWFLGIVGKGNQSHPLEKIAEQATGSRQPDLLGYELSSYLGVYSRPVPIKLLIFGTSETMVTAERLAMRLNANGQIAVSAFIEDHVADNTSCSDNAVMRTLCQHMGDNVGAIVLVPTGPKVSVLPLLMACQRFTAMRGIPLFLRQIVDEKMDVIPAGIHRWVLRCGTDAAILHAALHSLNIIEVDTAARLLGVATAGQRLATRANELSHVLRCDMNAISRWPKEFREDLSADKRTIGLIPARIAVWAAMPELATNLANQVRAIVGACAVIDASTKRDNAARQRVKRFVKELYEVRNRLPLTHGEPLEGEEHLRRLIAEASNGRFATTKDLLDAMVRAAERLSAARAPDYDLLIQELDELRSDVRRLLHDAQDQRQIQRTTIPQQVRPPHAVRNESNQT